MRHAHRLSVRAATAILIACVFAATAVIVVGTRSSASQHDKARIEAARAITNTELYEDALGSSYDEWVTVMGYFVLKDPAYLDRFAASRKTVETSLVALRNDALVHNPNDAAALDGLIATHARFADTDARVLKAIGDGDLAGAVGISGGTGTTADSDKLLGDLRARIAEQRVILRAAQDRQQAAEDATLRWSLGIGTMCAGLLLVIGLASFEMDRPPVAPRQRHHPRHRRRRSHGAS